MQRSVRMAFSAWRWRVVLGGELVLRLHRVFLKMLGTTLRDSFDAWVSYVQVKFSGCLQNYVSCWKSSVLEFIADCIFEH